METLFYKISQVLGITIIHSLWQGLIVYMALSLVLQFMVDKPASAKYKVAFGGLSIMLAWFAYTLYTEVGNYTALATLATQARQATLTVTEFVPVEVDHWTAPPAERYYFFIAGYLPYITMLYVAGLVWNTLKIMLAWNNIYRVRQQITPAGFQQQVNHLVQNLGITKFVKVAFSELIDVPCITGFIKPVILLPCAISSYLTAEEIKAILLHELAHVKRNDYLANLLQQAMGIVLFFNPFSRLINKIINTERENSCDDLVVHTTNTPLIYAQALLKLEQNKQQAWHLALAATGNKYHLLHRIERIMKTKKTTLNIRPALIALVLLTCSLSSIAWLKPEIKHGQVSVKAINNPLSADTFTDTVKSKNKIAKPAVKGKPAIKKGNKKLAYSSEYVDDAKMQALEAEVEKHATALEKYYNSDEFVKMQEKLEKQGKEMEAYYNSPKMKQLQENMEKKSREFEKMSDGPEMKKLQADLEVNGKKIEEYYNSPEFKKKQKELERESELLSKTQYGTEAYKKHVEAIAKLSKSYADYANNPAMKEQIELSKKLAAEASARYQSPEFAKQQDELRAYGDSMRKAYQNPAMKEQQEMMRKMSKEMREYQNKDEIKREKRALKEATDKIREYQKSPEFKKKMKEDIKGMKDDMKSMNSDVRERIKEEMAVARTYERKASKDRIDIIERTGRPDMLERKENRDVAERVEKREVADRAERRDVVERVEKREVAERAERPEMAEKRKAEREEIKDRVPAPARVRKSAPAPAAVPPVKERKVAPVKAEDVKPVN